MKYETILPQQQEGIWTFVLTFSSLCTQKSQLLGNLKVDIIHHT